MIDESLLDAPDDLLRADPRGLLRSVAAAGAHVRTAARGAAESPLTDLRPEGRPGTLLIAGAGPDAPLAADLLDALASDGVRVTLLRPLGALAAPGALTWALPRWAGPLDLLLVTSADGTEPGLTALVDAAYRRGCSVAAVAPAGSPLAETTAHRRNLAIPLTPAPFQDPAGHPYAPGPGWALLTPLLMLADRLGLIDAGPDAVQGLADRLDAVAERCGPSVGTSGNPAKTLATEFAAALPLLWSEGPVARAVARHAAATLTGLAGCPALAAELPGALTAHATLLAGGLAAGAGGAGGEDDFFRDRVDEPAPLHPRVTLVRTPLPPADGAPASASAAARDLAFEQGVAFGELSVEDDAGPLATAAELLARLDFAAVYLTVAAGLRH
jgi:hypothetical protein